MGWFHIDGKLVHTSAIKIDEAEMERIRSEYQPCVTTARIVNSDPPEPTIPLTQVEAMLREAYSEGVRECAHGLSPANPLRGIAVCSMERRNKWIANKIKEARQ